LAAITNDLNPATTAESHVDAIQFLDFLLSNGLRGSVEVTLLDPPYSPRQISECYKSVGRVCTTKDTQNAALYKECKDRIAKLCKPDGVVITCGWNSAGMGKTRGFEIKEILLVACGGAHNDYIVTVDRKIKTEEKCSWCGELHQGGPENCKNES
jgi:hypothetical protein